MGGSFVEGAALVAEFEADVDEGAHDVGVRRVVGVEDVGVGDVGAFVVDLLVQCVACLNVVHGGFSQVAVRVPGVFAHPPGRFVPRSRALFRGGAGPRSASSSDSDGAESTPGH